MNIHARLFYWMLQVPAVSSLLAILFGVTWGISALQERSENWESVSSVVAVYSEHRCTSMERDKSIIIRCIPETRSPHHH